MGMFKHLEMYAIATIPDWCPFFLSLELLGHYTNKKSGVLHWWLKIKI